MKNYFLNLNVDPKALNRKRFEYALLRKDGKDIGYIHIDYYLNHKSEYKNYKKDCPICGDPVYPRRCKDKRSCWFGKKHHCYHQPVNTIDTGEVIFKFNEIINKKMKRPKKETGGSNGPNGGVKKKHEDDDPIEFPPIDKSKVTKISSVKKAFELYDAKLGYFVADNGLSINQMMCNNHNFNYWKGNLNKKSILLELVPCMPNSLNLPKRKNGIWLKLPKRISGKKDTYVLVTFYYYDDYRYYYSQIVGFKNGEELENDTEKKTKVLLMGETFNFEYDSDLNLYQIQINSPLCIYVVNGKGDNENE